MVLAGAPLSTHVVINRAARHLREDNALYRMTLAFARGAVIHETRELGELDEVAQEIEKSGGSKVVLCGGDGSYMAGVTALARAFGEDRMPALALAPGGTVSTVARNWGLAGPLETYAKNLLNAVTEETATEVRKPTLRVRDDRNGEHIGFIFGAGLVANFFEHYNAAPRQGYEGAARIVAKIFAGSFVGSSLAKRILTPVPCTLAIDGALAERKAFSLIVASVVKDMGLHLHVAHRAGEDPHKVHVVASPLGPLALGPQMPLVMAGRRLRGSGHVDTLAATLRVTFDDDRSYVLDGDTLKCRWVDVSAGPELRLLVP